MWGSALVSIGGEGGGEGLGSILLGCSIVSNMVRPKAVDRDYYH